MAELETTTPTTPAPAPTNGEAAPTDRASVLAELRALDATPKNGEPEPEKPTEPEPTPEPEKTTTEEPAVPPPKELPAEEPGEDEAEEDGEEEDTTPAADPDLNKRLEAVNKREKRAKESMAREREAYQRERSAFEAEWSPRIKQAEEFADISRRVRHDPVGVLLGLGLTEDDFEPVAKVVYAHSTAARNNPQVREAAQRSMRERELSDQVAKLTRAVQDRDQRDQERDQRETVQRETVRFLDAVAKSASDETPLVRTMLEKSPEKARQRLAQVADAIIHETGEVPDHADVVAELEKLRRAELEELGIDIDTAIKRPKKLSPAADEKRPAKTLTNDLGKPTTPRSALSRKEELADVRKALEEGRLE